MPDLLVDFISCVWKDINRHQGQEKGLQGVVFIILVENVPVTKVLLRHVLPGTQAVMVTGDQLVEGIFIDRLCFDIIYILSKTAEIHLFYSSFPPT